MKLFGSPRGDAARDEKGAPNASGAAYPTIEGERGVPSVNRARSLQSRVSTILALGLMSALGLGLLTWYYAGAITRSARVQKIAQASVRTRAQGEMTLPSLGPIEPPRLVAAAATPAAPDPSALERVLGPAPEVPPAVAPAVAIPAYAPMGSAAPAPLNAVPRPVDRRLSGPVFARVSQSGSPDGLTPVTSGDAPPVALIPAAGNPQESPAALGAARGGAGEDPLGRLLQPTATPAVDARLLPTRRFLLAQGAFIDCTLETAIDSTYPGLTTCITATDTFSADGTVVLLERGTKLVGETQSQVQQGAARVFVLWREARTPTGVVVPLASPGTDSLGRTGLAGEVNRHFWERFGAAILVTVIDGAVQAGVQAASHNNGTLIVNPTATTDVTTEVLRGTVAIPPTITVAQGERIQVLVARDIDFRSVYELKSTVVPVPPGGSP